jgi:hypothetical protein
MTLNPKGFVRWVARGFMSRKKEVPAEDAGQEERYSADEQEVSFLRYWLKRGAENLAVILIMLVAALILRWTVPRIMEWAAPTIERVTGIKIPVPKRWPPPPKPKPDEEELRRLIEKWK